MKPKQISYRPEGNVYLLRDEPGAMIHPWPAGRIAELWHLDVAAVAEAHKNPGKWIDCPVIFPQQENPHASDPS